MDELTRLGDRLVADPPLPTTPVDEIRRRGRARRGRQRAVVAAAVVLVVLGIGGVAVARAGHDTTTVRTTPGTTVPAAPDLTVFLDPTATPAQIAAVQAELVADPAATRIDYWSHAASYQEFACLFRDQPDLVRGMAPDALPTSFRIFTDGGRPDAERLANLVTGQPGVKEVSYPPGPLPTGTTVVQLPDGGGTITVNPDQGPTVDPGARPRCDGPLRPTRIR